MIPTEGHVIPTEGHVITFFVMLIALHIALLLTANLPLPPKALAEEAGLCSVCYSALVAALERHLQETPQQNSQHWWKVCPVVDQ